MKTPEPKNSNYAASVVEIKAVIPLEKCDNVQAVSIFGFQGVVSKDIKPGDIGIVFPAETQLSEEFCYENNLFRHNDKNKDQAQKGYLEDNRRIKAVKFRGHRSDCLFMPLSSLSYLGIKESEFKVGMIFDTLNEREVCRKYVVREFLLRENKQRKAKLFTRVDRKYIPEHFDTDNYFRVSESIPGNAEVIITQKVHGTSIIVGNTIVAKKKRMRDVFAKFIGVNVQEKEFDVIYSSRRVIKDLNNPDHVHFYDSDVWTHYGSKIASIIPKNYILYGEIIGWTPEGAPIQTGYTYNQPEKQATIYVYRIAIVNEDGLVVDLTWDQLTEFCRNNGLSHVPELWRGFKKDFKPEDFMDRRYYDEGAKQCLPLSDKNTVDEGVCVRIDGLRPYIAKCKSAKFFEFETKQLDKGEQDIESLGGEVTEAGDIQ